MTDTKQVIRDLEHLSSCLEDMDLEYESLIASRGIALLERLTAEVERLTPKTITTHSACDLLNHKQYRGVTDWRPSVFDKDALSSETVGLRLDAWTAQTLANRALIERQEDNTRG